MEKPKVGTWESLGALVVVSILLILAIHATVGLDWGQTGAAWVQAVGSVGAIVVALAAPYWHAGAAKREEQLERLQTLREIVSTASELSETAEWAVMTYDNLRSLMYDGFKKKDFQAIATVLDRLPHHDVRPPSLIPHLLAVRRAMDSLPGALEWIEKAYEESFADPSEAISDVRDRHHDVLRALIEIDKAIHHATSKN